MAIELPHAYQQGGVMAPHFGRPEVDANVERVGGPLSQHVGQVVEAVSDGVQHGGLQPDLPRIVDGLNNRCGIAYSRSHKSSGP